MNSSDSFGIGSGNSSADVSTYDFRNSSGGATNIHDPHDNSSLADILNDTADRASAVLVQQSNYHFHGWAVVAPMALVIICIIVLAIGGNIMVILTILRHRGMRTRTNMFIVNLAVADILVAALDMPFSLITLIEGDWIFGDSMCQLNGFTMALFLICSIHTLMYISVHKYISITRPFSRAMTPRRIKIMIAASWLWATFCALGPVIGWNENIYKKGASQCGPAIPNDFKSRSHSLLITTSNFVVPLGVMSFCYYKIFREIHVHMCRIRKTSNIDLENSVQQQKKVATTLFLVLACFVSCWFPFVAYSNWAAFSKNKGAIPLIMNPLSYWCGYLNSACNPIIYAFRSPSFRKGYKEIMCGAPSPGLSAVNSLSFRSRSARSSQKSTTNTVNVHDTPQTLHRQRTMLSQTSWRSLPLIPNLIRSFSTTKSERNSEPDTPEDAESLQASGCGLCGLCNPRPSSYEVTKTDDPTPQNGNTAHALNDINEDEECQINENSNAEDKGHVKNELQLDIEKESFEEWGKNHCNSEGIDINEDSNVSL